jgi:hypothetical protein
MTEKKSYATLLRTYYGHDSAASPLGQLPSFFHFTSDSVVLFWTRSFDIHTARYSAFQIFPLSGWKETFGLGAGYGKLN